MRGRALLPEAQFSSLVVPPRAGAMRSGVPAVQSGRLCASRTAFSVQNVLLPQTTGVRPQSFAGERSSRGTSTFPNEDGAVRGPGPTVRGR
ncbi:hypothetical protein BKH38_08460 [Actinomyces naeslundii]|nr:hypothetical protein BKH38_08460 [Actinomyces naeslundii]